MPYTLWYGHLPDGMRDVTADGMGGLYISGFDSRRRVCLILYAPPYGRPLRTVSMLPYWDYGRYTPTVLTARDPLRERKLYVLLYLHPDNLGISQTSLFRLDLDSGRRQLLSSATSPFWAPTAMLPRNNGSVIISLSGLGPLLIFRNCNETVCSPAMPLPSAASDAVGKAGLAQVGGGLGHNGSLCMVVGNTFLSSDDAAVVCEAPNGKLTPILPLVNSSMALPSHPLLPGPSVLQAGASGNLYVITSDLANEYGYSQDGACGTWVSLT